MSVQERAQAHLSQLDKEVRSDPDPDPDPGRRPSDANHV